VQIVASRGRKRNSRATRKVRGHYPAAPNFSGRTSRTKQWRSKQFGYTTISPATGATIRRLAKLERRTLAVMHGSSFSSAGAPVLETLAGFYDDLLQKGAPAR